MRILYLFFVWLHILSAVVWIGGIVFLTIVLVPVTRKPDYQNIASSLIYWSGVRFRLVSWICLVALILSGAFLLHYRGLGSVDLILFIKLLLVAIILILSAYHDFFAGPKAMELWQKDSASTEALRLRRQAGLIGRINLTLALLVVAMAVVLVRGWFW